MVDSKIPIIIKICKTEAFVVFSVVISNRGSVKEFQFTRRGALCC